MFLEALPFNNAETIEDNVKVGTIHALHVHNKSDYPIYDMHLFWNGPEPEETTIVVVGDMAALAGDSTHVITEEHYPKLPLEVGFGLLFEDANGRPWARSSRGRLSALRSEPWRDLARTGRSDLIFHLSQRQVRRLING